MNAIGISAFKFYFTSLLLCLFSTNYAQAMNNKADSIRSLSKEKIIEMAKELIEQKQPGLQLKYDYYEISGMANSKEVIVQFRKLFQITPQTSENGPFRIKNISVNLVSGALYPFDDGFYAEGFRNYTDEEIKIIDFIKVHTSLPYPEGRDYEYDIEVKDTYYDIYIRKNGSFINYHLDKVTGEQTGRNELNATRALFPDSELKPEDPLTRIF